MENFKTASLTVKALFDAMNPASRSAVRYYYKYMRENMCYERDVAKFQTLRHIVEYVDRYIK